MIFHYIHGFSWFSILFTIFSPWNPTSSPYVPGLFQAPRIASRGPGGSWPTTRSCCWKPRRRCRETRCWRWCWWTRCGKRTATWARTGHVEPGGSGSWENQGGDIQSESEQSEHLDLVKEWGLNRIGQDITIGLFHDQNGRTSECSCDILQRSPEHVGKFDAGRRVRNFVMGKVMKNG